MNKGFLFFGASILVSLTACSGGGGDNDFSGEYIFNTALVRDGCGIGLDQYRSIPLDVEQDGDKITATNLATNTVLTGSTLGNGWMVATSSPSGNCLGSAQIVYNGDSSGGVAVVVSCAGAGECQTEYSATVIRN